MTAHRADAWCVCERCASTRAREQVLIRCIAELGEAERAESDPAAKEALSHAQLQLADALNAMAASRRRP